jgi:hypothetical protein
MSQANIEAILRRLREAGYAVDQKAITLRRRTVYRITARNKAGRVRIACATGEDAAVIKLVKELGV